MTVWDNDSHEQNDAPEKVSGSIDSTPEPNPVNCYVDTSSAADPNTNPKSAMGDHSDAIKKIEVTHRPEIGPMTSTPSTTVSDATSTTLPTKPPVRTESPGKLMYFLPTVCLICGVIWLGPMIVERYQYSATKGRILAEYEVATEMLKSEPLSNVSMAYQLVAQKISPSVVKISAGNTRGGKIPLTGGQGSGVVVSNDGYIVTNLHVIREALDAPSRQSSIIVRFSDRTREVAEVIGVDELSDLAVLKVNRNDLIAAEWGDSQELKVGSMVWAIGSPYGYENSVTAGIVSGRNRQGQDRPEDRVSDLQEFIQTDAAVNPGNSGGPLVDPQGRVVGINTQIFGQQFQGISFAIPSADAKYVTEEIIANGKVRRGYLGANLALGDFGWGVNSTLSQASGAIISNIRSGHPADLAGLSRNDVVTKFNDIEIDSSQQLYHQISITPPGSEVPLEIVRNGERISLRLKVGRRPASIR